VNKTGVHFSTQGDLGTGNITLKQTSSADADAEQQISIELQEDVTLRFAARYLCYFTKATPLSTQVTLNLAADSPLMVDYHLSG
jgi:proliferating cell nuclear antigen